MSVVGWQAAGPGGRQRSSAVEGGDLRQIEGAGFPVEQRGHALAAGHGYLVAVPSRGPGDGSAAGGIDPGLNLVVVGGGEASGEVGVLSESGAPPVPQLQTVRFADPGDA